MVSWLAHALVLGAAATTAAFDEVGADEQCLGVVESMEKYGDFEVRALCRARFTPQFCGEANGLLGTRPWTADRIQAFCNQWVAMWPSDDALRVLQAAKAAQIEDTVAEKAKRAAKKMAKDNEASMAAASRQMDLTTTTKTTTVMATGVQPWRRQPLAFAPFRRWGGFARPGQQKYEEVSDAMPLVAARSWSKPAAVVGLAVVGLTGCGAVLVLRRGADAAYAYSAAVVKESHQAAGAGSQ